MLGVGGKRGKTGKHKTSIYTIFFYLFHRICNARRVKLNYMTHKKYWGMQFVRQNAEEEETE
jgi:hypothetical protein